MERRVSVNAKATSGGSTIHPDGPPPEWADVGWPEADEDEARAAQADGEAKPQNQGPCLYLGPAGERCDRPALVGGFCAKHGSGGRVVEAFRNPARILAALAAIVALLWPYVSDLVREIMRWAHAR